MCVTGAQAAPESAMRIRATQKSVPELAMPTMPKVKCELREHALFDGE